MLSSIEILFKINTAPKQNKAKKIVRMTSFSKTKPAWFLRGGSKEYGLIVVTVNFIVQLSYLK